MAKKKVLWFVAETERENDGRSESVYVYKSGRSIWISAGNSREHLCHPSVRSVESVKREIFLVFQKKVTSIGDR